MDSDADADAGSQPKKPPRVVFVSKKNDKYSTEVSVVYDGTNKDEFEKNLDAQFQKWKKEIIGEEVGSSDSVASERPVASAPLERTLASVESKTVAAPPERTVASPSSPSAPPKRTVSFGRTGTMWEEINGTNRQNRESRNPVFYHSNSGVWWYATVIGIKNKGLYSLSLYDGHATPVNNVSPNEMYDVPNEIFKSHNAKDPPKLGYILDTSTYNFIAKEYVKTGGSSTAKKSRKSVHRMRRKSYKRK